MNNPQTSGFEFTLANGQVTGIERVINGHVGSAHLPTNAAFTVGTNTITETLTGTHETTVRQFVQDASNTALYHIGSESTTILHPTTTYDHGFIFGFGFTITNGSVTAEQITQGASGHTHTVHTSPTANFSVSGGNVTETVVHGNVVEQIKFTPDGTTGLYAIASDTKTFIQSGTATTLLAVDPFERAKFTIDSDSHITQVQTVHTDGSSVTTTPHANTTFAQLAAGYVVETVTRGNHSSYEVFHDGNGDGIYTAVAHGSGTTVDLVGLKAQISTMIDAVT